MYVYVVVYYYVLLCFIMLCYIILHRSSQRQGLRTWPKQLTLLYYSTLFYSTLLYSTLLYSTLLYSALFYSTLVYPTLRAGPASLAKAVHPTSGGCQRRDVLQRGPPYTSSLLI